MEPVNKIYKHPDLVDIFMDWAFTYNEKKEAMVLAVDKYQFREALVILLEEMEER